MERLRETWPVGALLTLVVVSYNMARELPRTLYSLSPRYQRGISSADYEVLLVDNGSTTAPREEDVRSYGENFRLRRCEIPTPSPGPAVNHGARAAQAPLLGIMIDGAYILSPGALRSSLEAWSAYDQAIATVPRFYLGAGQQGSTIALGYDQEAEDQLLAQLNWQGDGYRLFERSSTIGQSRDTSILGRPFESNLLVVANELFHEVGGFDEQFNAPGGGFANIDFFDRLVNRAGTTCVTALGEGIFHQVHGGSTTNVSTTVQQEKIAAYRDDYRRVRGREWRPTRYRHAFHGVTTSPKAVAARRTGVNFETVSRVEEFLHDHAEKFGRDENA